MQPWFQRQNNIMRNYDPDIGTIITYNTKQITFWVRESYIIILYDLLAIIFFAT